MKSEQRTIKVLGLAGSPRWGGNTELLLDAFLAGATEAGGKAEKRRLSRLTVAGCTACNGCQRTGSCIVTDDFHSIDEQLIAADVIVLASPLYFANLPAQVKSLVDRSQSQWVRKFLLKDQLPATVAGHMRRRGIFLCVAGISGEDFSGVIRTVKYFFDLYQTDYWADLLLGDIDAKGAIEAHPTALRAAFDLGVRAVEESRCRDNIEMCGHAKQDRIRDD